MEGDWEPNWGQDNFPPMLLRDAIINLAEPYYDFGYEFRNVPLYIIHFNDLSEILWFPASRPDELKEVAQD
jgi:hypothetical protein